MSEQPPAPRPPLPFPDSLCHLCAHHRLVRGARSSFLHCTAPRLPKYPRQPVAQCGSFTAAPPAD